MNFQQKIYYADKPIVLTGDKEEYINEHAEARHYQFLNDGALPDYTTAISLLDRADIKGILIEGRSLDALMDHLLQTYRTIDAGGGITWNEEGEILMIYRRGKWDLPKGKLDKGELIAECAVREVSEETGIKNIKLGDKITDTYHLYHQSGELLLKRTAWYKMKASAAQKLKPQKAEDILEARWVKEKDLAPLAAQSYEAIQEVLKCAGLKW